MGGFGGWEGALKRLVTGHHGGGPVGAGAAPAAAMPQIPQAGGPPPAMDTGGFNGEYSPNREDYGQAAGGGMAEPPQSAAPAGGAPGTDWRKKLRGGLQGAGGATAGMDVTQGMRPQPRIPGLLEY